MTSTAAAAGSRETVYAAIELSKKTWVLRQRGRPHMEPCP